MPSSSPLAGPEGARQGSLADLIPEQLADLKRNGGFNVRGSDDKIYRILSGYGQWGNNVMGEDRHDILSRLGRWPISRDEHCMTGMACYLSQKVHLECDAPYFVRHACSQGVYERDRQHMEDMGDYGGKI